MEKVLNGFNVASFQLVIRNDNHCPTCRRWYLIVEKDIHKLQSGSVEWFDEWVRRRNGDKYQTINIIPELKYNLSEWKLNSNEEINVNVTHFLLQIKINKYKWCPKNIKFYISFHESGKNAYHRAKEILSNSELGNLKNGYWKNDINNEDNDKGQFFIIVKLKPNENICLNDFCPQIQHDNF